MNTSATGFQPSCIKKFGPSLGARVFQAFSEAFNWLPLGCVVGNRILIVHGGIGDGNWDLERLRSVQRPLNNDQLYADPVIYNVLWSDPIPETLEGSFGVHYSPRDGHAKKICRFGEDVTMAFLKRNKLDMLIRSHEAMQKGCGYEVMHGGKCVRVFSARDYEGHINDACVFSIRRRNPMGDVLSHTILVRPQVLRSIHFGERPQDEDDHPTSVFNCGAADETESGDSEA